LIRSLSICVCALLLAATSVGAEEPAKAVAAEGKATPAKTIDTSTLEAARTPFHELNERLIGAASRAVRFDWRQKTLGFGLLTSSLLELNNFSSARAGAFVRLPHGDFLFEFAASRVFVSGSDSTDQLAQTPYRQVGRPSRWELDANVDYVLAEGVVTPRPDFIPPAQLVFSVTGGFRYLIYAQTWRSLSASEVGLALFSPTLQQAELDNLDRARLPAMKLDGDRFALLGGFSLDLYFHSGIFLGPRVLLAPPIFSGLSGSSLGAFWELTFRIGWMQ
jgi:hypothetical protein